jgi:hypothetical protein
MSDSTKHDEPPSEPPDWDRNKHRPKDEKKPPQYLHQPERGESAKSKRDA